MEVRVVVLMQKLLEVETDRSCDTDDDIIQIQKEQKAAGGYCIFGQAQTNNTLDGHLRQQSFSMRQMLPDEDVPRTLKRPQAEKHGAPSQFHVGSLFRLQ